MQEEYCDPRTRHGSEFADMPENSPGRSGDFNTQVVLAVMNVGRDSCLAPPHFHSH